MIADVAAARRTSDEAAATGKDRDPSLSKLETGTSASSVGAVCVTLNVGVRSRSLAFPETSKSVPSTEPVKKYDETRPLERSYAAPSGSLAGMKPSV